MSLSLGVKAAYGSFTLQGAETGTRKWWVSILCYVLYTLDMDRDRGKEQLLIFCPSQSLSRSRSRTVRMSHYRHRFLVTAFVKCERALKLYFLVKMTMTHLPLSEQHEQIYMTVEKSPSSPKYVDVQCFSSVIYKCHIYVMIKKTTTAARDVKLMYILLWLHRPLRCWSKVQGSTMITLAIH